MMSVRQGRLIGRELKLTGEGIENGRPSYPGGRIIEPDPAAVANFKRVLAQQAATAPARRQTGIQRAGNGRLDVDLQRKVDEIKARAGSRAGAEKEHDEMARPMKMTDEEIIAAHRRYVLEFSSLAATAKTTPLAEAPLQKRMIRLDLPTRDRAGKFSLAEIERVCEVHNLRPEDIPQSAWPDGEANPDSAPPAKRPEAQGKNSMAKRAKNAVVDQAAEPAPPPSPLAAVETAGDLATQLGALQALLSMAAAQRVTVGGRMVLELRAEVEF